MKEKIKILALFGKSGSGKDTIQQILLQEDKRKASFTMGDTIFHKIISCTTRPMREGEKQGIDYAFITEKQFTQLIYDELFIEALNFNNWFYGTLITALDPSKINIGIFTPAGINNLYDTADAYNLQILPIYIFAAAKTRMYRSLRRETYPDIGEICRRYPADEKDFADILYDHLIIYNDIEPIKEINVVKTISNYCKDFFG